MTKKIDKKIIYHLLFRDLRVVDGNGKVAFEADVGVRNGRIDAVGDLGNSEADRVIEGPGLVLAPGFIDIHSHSDFTILIDPLAESKVRQGVTTEAIGQCGGSASPLAGEKRERVRKQYLEITIDWATLGEYRRRVEDGGTAVNIVPLTGHGNLRGSIIGYRGGSPSREEMKRMLTLLEDELAAGSRGISTGLVYPPGSFSDFAELAGLIGLAAKAEGIYATHMRNESDTVEEAVGEAIRLAEETGVSLQISHLKAQGRRNWGRLAACLEKIEASRSRGFNVTCDRYPYLASATELDILLPGWASEGGAGEELRRLKDPAERRRMSPEVDRDDWDGVVISHVATEANRSIEGMNLAQIAEKRNVSPLDCFYELLIEEELNVEALFFGMSPDNLRRILGKPYCMIGSDASARAATGPLSRGKPHPRTFGTFPQVLDEFVKDGTLTLEEAVFKMTGQPARKLGLADRGMIREGAAADLVIFNPETIRSRATYREPKRYPQGIEYVIVNGEIVMEDGEHTGKLPGRFL